MNKFELILIGIFTCFEEKSIKMDNSWPTKKKYRSDIFKLN
jgi:hypothetical protein